MISGVGFNSFAPSYSFIPSELDSLVSRVGLVFVACCVVVTVGTVLYYATKACQYYLNPAYQFADPLKITKCKILLQDLLKALDKDKAALAKECEALHHSVKEKDQDVLKGLFDFYLTTNLDRAHKIAQRFTSPSMRLEAAAALWGKDVKNCLDLVDEKSLLTPWTGTGSLIDEVKKFLSYAKSAHLFEGFKREALEKSKACVAQCKDGLAQVEAWGEIAKAYQELGMDKKWKGVEFTTFLKQATKAYNEQSRTPSDRFKANITLAKAQHLNGESCTSALYYASVSVKGGSYQDVDLLVALLIELSQLEEAKKSLDTAFDALKNGKKEKDHDKKVDRANAFLRLAQAYSNVQNAYNSYDQEHGGAKAEEALGYALTFIKELTEDSEEARNTKIDLLKRVCGLATQREQTQSALDMLERLYRNSDEPTQKKIVPVLLRYSNDSFVKQWLATLTWDRIPELCNLASHCPMHKMLMLDTAERLLFHYSAHTEGMQSCVAEGYLNVDIEKSRKVLNRYAMERAGDYGLLVVINSLFLGLLPVAPPSGAIGAAAMTLLSNGLRILNVQF